MTTPTRSARLKLAVTAASVVTIGGLVAIAAPAIAPWIPVSVHQALGGPVTTTPGTVDDLFQLTGTGEYAVHTGFPVSHDDVDAEHQIAAGVWPWALPEGWDFPRNRGIPDTPRHHERGMGVRAAFSMYASEILERVKYRGTTGAEKQHLLDALQSAYTHLYDAGLLRDSRFVTSPSIRSATDERPRS